MRRGGALLLTVAAAACGDERPSRREPRDDEPVRRPAVDADGRDQTLHHVLDYSGEVVVLQPTDFDDYREVVDAAIALDPGRVTALPLVMRETTAGGKPIFVKGFDAARTPLQSYPLVGAWPSDDPAPDDPAPGPALDPAPADFADEPPPAPVDYSGAPIRAVLGRVLAQWLRVRVGDTIQVEDQTLEVVGIATFGFDYFDEVVVVTTFAAAQRLFGLGDVATAVELHLASPDRAADLADRLQATLGADFQVKDWCEMNPTLC